jgi:hypothetical protein
MLSISAPSLPTSFFFCGTAIYDSIASVSKNFNFYSVKLFGGTVARKIPLPLKTLKTRTI